MKTLLPILKTKLFLLGFVFACTNIPFAMNNSFEITVQTDKADYVPGEFVVISATCPEHSTQITIAVPADDTQRTTVDESFTKDAPSVIFPFDVKAFPNPSGDQFSLYLEGANHEKVSIVVYDAMGRELKRFEKENGNIPIIFGRDLKGGMYVVEVRQGDNHKTIKLIKQ